MRRRAEIDPGHARRLLEAPRRVPRRPPEAEQVAALGRGEGDRQRDIDAAVRGAHTERRVQRHEGRVVEAEDLQLEYLREMQAIIAESAPNECVGLYCMQLLDLGVEHNALAE